MGPQPTVLIAVELTEILKTTPDQPPAESPEATKKLLEDRRVHILAGNPYRLNVGGAGRAPSLPPMSFAIATAAGQRTL
jgi:hypothetical protein